MKTRARRLLPTLGLVPFLGYLTVFLFIPTIIIVVGAFTDHGRASLTNIQGLANPTVWQALKQSLILSASTAAIGAVFGSLLAYALVSGNPSGLARRAATSVCGVLAQFGGVMLAFAFIATLSYSGSLTDLLRDHAGIDIFGSGWLFALPGLILVYSYFQIPLMVIVFLPALDGIRVQWREAAENLGATTWQFWRHVGGPLLFPAFLGSALLLFANAFASYATAAALVSQGNPITPLYIRAALTSEIILGRQNLAYALALEMIVVVAIVMAAYALLVRRTSKWLS
ncbi:ABC transporter permease [Leekyejoonella antrihumi]|uniref:ABC transporter permease subunit n=1 Tax=Leekyejoonella antrihumi TaxID=1660198 RepID=A0A563E614_9MICO|nr:ABC transporter permease subunit [Leekyejoonella antrihumi]TWP37284.1 ABC transporter permease subunit [Leekyejoonella antrihumi]